MATNNGLLVLGAIIVVIIVIVGAYLLTSGPIQSSSTVTTTYVGNTTTSAASTLSTATTTVAMSTETVYLNESENPYGFIPHNLTVANGTIVTFYVHSLKANGYPHSFALEAPNGTLVYQSNVIMPGQTLNTTYTFNNLGITLRR